jgi:DNA relaxase NicK
VQTITSSNERAGRTVYVGKGEVDKFFRAYEKGFELAGKVAGIVVTAIDGHPVEDIYRCEVELKAESRPILGRSSVGTSISAGELSLLRRCPARR